jgi:methionyl-tRNA formyltransferase
MTNIILFGCKDTTLHTAKFLHGLGLSIHLITISSSTADANEVAGYVDLNDSHELFSSIYVAESYSLREKRDIENISHTTHEGLGFCIGWQRLIPKEILDHFNLGVFGMHGSSRNLPFGKGRSPMNWAIIEGREWFHTSLFKYQLGVDDGPIVETYTFSINSGDTAETMHYKNTLAMCHLIQKNLNALRSAAETFHPQAITHGESFYPKRNPTDGTIDWRDDIFNIERLVRAVTNPFYGASTFLNGVEVIILRCTVFYTDIEQHPFKDTPFGEIVDVFPNEKFLVRCSGGILLVHESRGSKPLRNSRFDESVGTLASFERNLYGFFDV